MHGLDPSGVFCPQKHLKPESYVYPSLTRYTPPSLVTPSVANVQCLIDTPLRKRLNSRQVVFLVLGLYQDSPNSEWQTKTITYVSTLLKIRLFHHKVSEVVTNIRRVVAHALVWPSEVLTGIPRLKRDKTVFQLVVTFLRDILIISSGSHLGVRKRNLTPC